MSFSMGGGSGGGGWRLSDSCPGVCTVTQWIYRTANLGNAHWFGLVRNVLDFHFLPPSFFPSLLLPSFLFFFPSVPSFSFLPTLSCIISQLVNAWGISYYPDLSRHCWSLLLSHKVLTEQLPKTWSYCSVVLMPNRAGSLLACLPSECADTLLSALARDSK